MVYGQDYAAEETIYQAINTRINEGVEVIEGVEFTTTKELGKIKRIDPLGITDLRVRGMWHIQNPFRVFEYVYQRDNNRAFNFMAIINTDKWQSFANRDQLQMVIAQTPNANLRDVYIKNPNNPAQLRPAKLIEFWQ